jgi:hypothetical protein
MCRPLPLVLLTTAFLTGACHRGKPAEPAPPPPPPITTGEAVVRAMHDRYADAWYHTVRFRQTVVRTMADGSHPPDEVWLEHGDIPGKLRIDQGRDYNGNGVIYSGDSLFVFRDGQLTRRVAQRNALLVLGFDVYRQPVERTLEILKAEGFDVSRFHTDRWEGHRVYVVGADEGDLRTAQFWVDEDRLLFVRLLRAGAGANAGVQDIRFDDYEPLGRGWISPLVRFLVDGKEVSREEYFDIEVNPDLEPGLFDPSQWGKEGR